jgi:hypothetical protein
MRLAVRRFLRMREFVTSDLQLASFLATKDHRIVRVEGPSERRCFVFTGNPQEDASAFHRGEALVEPLTLFTAYRLLKRRLFQTA